MCLLPGKPRVCFCDKQIKKRISSVQERNAYPVSELCLLQLFAVLTAKSCGKHEI